MGYKKSFKLLNSFRFMNFRHIKIKYPKLLFLILTISLGIFILYEAKYYSPLHTFIVSLKYFGTFLGGFFYSYGFTAAPATAILLIIAKEQNLILAITIGIMGAVLSDFLIFSFIRHSFMNELNKLKQEKFLKKLRKGEKQLFGRYKKYFFLILSSFFIASPLPTEIGIAMMASVKNISLRKFLIIAFFLHGLGISLILILGKLI